MNTYFKINNIETMRGLSTSVLGIEYIGLQLGIPKQKTIIVMIVYYQRLKCV